MVAQAKGCSADADIVVSGDFLGDRGCSVFADGDGACGAAFADGGDEFAFECFHEFVAGGFSLGDCLGRWDGWGFVCLVATGESEQEDGCGEGGFVHSACSKITGVLMLWSVDGALTQKTGLAARARRLGFGLSIWRRRGQVFLLGLVW